MSAVLLGSLAVLAGASSCASGEVPDAQGNSAGMPASGAGGSSAASGGNGGSAGGVLPGGGSAGSANPAAGTGAGATSGTAGTGSGGTNTSGGSAGSGTSGSAGSGSGGTGMAGTGGGSGCTDSPPPNGTCSDAVAYGWCGQSWLNGACARSCGTCTGGGTGGSSSAGGSSNTGGTSSTGGSSGAGAAGGGNVAPPPDIQGGMQGWASRYWDCCKPTCSWPSNTGGRSPAKTCTQQNQSISDVNAKSACDNGGTAFMCWNESPWQVGDKLSYGFVAANTTCGRCFHLQFTGQSHNGGMGSKTEGLAGKHMIVQATNTGNIDSNQVDLLIPGGGVGANNACDTQWNASDSDLGAQYGGFLTACNGDLSCVKQRCEKLFAGKQELMDGCNWFLGWFGGADNPTFTLQQIACPAEITQRSGLPDPG